MFATWFTCLHTPEYTHTQIHTLMYGHEFYKHRCAHTVKHQAEPRDTHVNIPYQTYPKAGTHVTHRQMQRRACIQPYWQ